MFLHGIMQYVILWDLLYVLTLMPWGPIQVILCINISFFLCVCVCVLWIGLFL